MKKNTRNSIRTQIIKSNTRFQNATKAEKRVLIAKDVLARLETGQYKAKAGTYWRTRGVETRKLIWGAENVEGFSRNTEGLQSYIVNGDIKCTCCALGGMITSCIAKENDFFLADANFLSEVGFSGTNVRKRLLRFFSEKQLCQIESYFEGYCNSDIYGEKRDERAVAFNYDNPNDKARLVKIMQNIVDNKGTFKPNLL